MINKLGQFTVLVAISLFLSCNEGGNQRPSNIESTQLVRYYDRDPDYEIDVTVGKGSFTGTLVDYEMGAWTGLIFQAGNGKKYSLAYCTDKPKSDLNGERVRINFDDMKLLDSVIKSLEAGSDEYKGKSFVVNWQKFIYNDGLSPGVESPVIIDFKAPMIDPEFLTESGSSSLNGVYLYNCPGSTYGDAYYNEYYIQFFNDHTFAAKWEECEVGGLIEGSYKTKGNLVFLKSDERTDTFTTSNNKLYPVTENHFLHCVICENGGHYRLNSENKSSIKNDRAVTRKVRYLYYSNGGFVAYYSDGTSIGCPRCDYQFTDPNELKPDENTSTYTVQSDGSLLVDGSYVVVPKNSPDDVGEGWAIIDYKPAE